MYKNGIPLYMDYLTINEKLAEKVAYINKKPPTIFQAGGFCTKFLNRYPYGKFKMGLFSWL